MPNPNVVAAVSPPHRRSSAPPASLSEAIVPKLSPAATPCAAVVPTRPIPIATATATTVQPAPPPFERVTALFVVYDADGTPAGELIYMTKKMLGLGHCAACDITHGPRKEKPEFTKLKSFGWGVPLLNIHRDEMDASLAAAVGAQLPCVAARTMSRDVLLLGQGALATCEGDVFRFQDLVNLALRVHGLSAPPVPLRRNSATAMGVAAQVPVGQREWVRRRSGDLNRQRGEEDAVVPWSNT